MSDGMSPKIVDVARRRKEERVAWVTTMSASAVLFLSCGFLMSFSVFFLELKVYFNTGAHEVSWLVALQFSIAMIIGPLSVSMSRRFDSRFVVFVGGYTISLGLIISAFSNAMFLLYFSYGIMPGIGLGLVISSALSSIEFKADNPSQNTRRLVCYTGASLGGIILPLVANFFIQLYDWYGALLLLCASMLNICVFSILLKRPLVATEKQNTSMFGNGTTSLNGSYRMAAGNTVTENQNLINGHDRNTPKVDYPLVNELAIIRKTPMYILYLVIHVLVGMALFIPSVYLTAYAIESNVDEVYVVFYIPMLSLGALLSHTVITLNPFDFSPYIILIISVAIATLGSCAIPLKTTAGVLFAFAVVHGFAKTVITTTLDDIASKMVKESDGTPRMTLCLPLLGVGQLVGIVLTGVAFDATGTYDLAFYVGGALLGMVLLLILPTLVQRCRAEDTNCGRRPKKIVQERRAYRSSSL
ncbi:monocarboxylate transporter 13-like [Saccoglossus kowalevskii]|uniref:Monocarboxylate transporter 1-like n=1 Tax=Saccoglossus kowalevskii TaxID=10224 RepID=A0ABM0N0M5_SACKO|nr:PREDICTED: monocarboxylate transporter 1-like [Saccoglossus kowalevskii]